MIVKNSMKVKRSDNAIWRVIDGEVVVLLTRGEMLYALKGCGSQVWELIEGEMAVLDIVQKICAEYDVEPKRAEKEIYEFVNKLAGMKLVEIVPAESNEVNREW